LKGVPRVLFAVFFNPDARDQPQMANYFPKLATRWPHAGLSGYISIFGDAESVDLDCDWHGDIFCRNGMLEARKMVNPQ